MLKQRVITAIVLALTVFAVLILGTSQWVAGLLAVILFLVTTEMLNLLLTIKRGIRWGVAIVFAVLFYFATEFLNLRNVFYLNVASLLCWISILIYLFEYRQNARWPLAVRSFLVLITLFLFFSSVSGLYYLHFHFSAGGWVMLYLLTLVWIADIGAYFSGKRFGKTQLAPTISPGKSREGVVGGLVFTSLWSVLVYFFWLDWQISVLEVLLLSVAVASVSVIGDLYESILKREAGDKDSGTLLPGHGGMYDRIDSVIAAAPVFVVGLYMTGVM